MEHVVLHAHGNTLYLNGTGLLIVIALILNDGITVINFNNHPAQRARGGYTRFHAFLLKPIEKSHSSKVGCP
jgi:hypothetical protein